MRNTGAARADTGLTGSAHSVAAFATARKSHDALPALLGTEADRLLRLPRTLGTGNDYEMKDARTIPIAGAMECGFVQVDLGLVGFGTAALALSPDIVLFASEGDPLAGAR